MPRPVTRGLVLAAVSAICSGFSGPLAKSLIDAGLSPLQAVWTRLAGTALVLNSAEAVPVPRLTSPVPFPRRSGPARIGAGHVLPPLT